LSPLAAQSSAVILATTTSTRDAGLLDSILPDFERASGYTVKVIAVGSGQALAMGKRGDDLKMMVDYEVFREQTTQVKNDRGVVQMQVRW